MPICTSQEILKEAFAQRYGVPAFNIFDDLSLKGILTGAVENRAPVIIQVSVKTLRYWGLETVTRLFQSQARDLSVPAALHLDHCPDPELAEACIRAGWNSVLFDGSSLSFDENLEITTRIKRIAAEFGAGVEGELVTVAGVEDGVGSDAEGELLPVAKAVDFIRESGIDFYAPAVGTAHGMYREAPTIRYDRVEEILNETSLPLVLHGGTGLADEVFTRLIKLGTAKVNISTALKQRYADAFADYLAEHRGEYNPLKLLGAVERDIVDFAGEYFKLFKSAGRA